MIPKAVGTEVDRAKINHRVMKRIEAFHNDLVGSLKHQEAPRVPAEAHVRSAGWRFHDMV